MNFKVSIFDEFRLAKHNIFLYYVCPSNFITILNRLFWMMILLGKNWPHKNHSSFSLVSKAIKPLNTIASLSYPIFLIFSTQETFWCLLNAWTLPSKLKLIENCLFFLTVARTGFNAREAVGRRASKERRSTISYRWGDNLWRQWNGKNIFHFNFFSPNCEYYFEPTQMTEKTFRQNSWKFQIGWLFFIFIPSAHLKKSFESTHTQIWILNQLPESAKSSKSQRCK